MGRAFIGNFKGPPGDEGKQGKQGIQGPMGPAGPTGAVDGNTPIEFTEAEALANIESGESISTIFGKTKKILGSLLIGAGSTLLGKNLTANQALVSDASGKVNVSGISATELGYLSGVTKNIQTQFGEQNEKFINCKYITSRRGIIVAANCIAIYPQTNHSTASMNIKYSTIYTSVCA